MSSQERITGAVHRAGDELNETLPKGVSPENSPDAPLYGKSSKLESIDLVNFIMEAEDERRGRDNRRCLHERRRIVYATRQKHRETLL